MKIFFLTATIVSSFFLNSFSVAAQNKARMARCVSVNGYWVSKSNIHAPLDHVIQFYNNDHQLVYSETLTGIKLNTNKRKTKLKLKNALEQSLQDWQAHQQPATDKDYVLTAFKH